MVIFAPKLQDLEGMAGVEIESQILPPTSLSTGRSTKDYVS